MSLPPPGPPGVRQQLRGLARLREAPPGRWVFAARAALCMGVPIAWGGRWERLVRG